MNAWEKNFRKVTPYVPGEQPIDQNIIKLNTNENPYPPSPGVLKGVAQLDAAQFNKYPDFKSTKLTDSLANLYGLDSGQIFVGVGSDDVLAMSFMAFFNSERPILFPNITYSFYVVWADLFQIPYICPPLDENFRIKKEDYYQDNGGVVIANPNAPTSIYENLEFIRDILDHNQKSVVIVDEAYIDFGGKSAIELLNEYKNLLVVQTFSKSRAMAGMRIGYAMGSKELIEELNCVKYSYNSYTMNMATIQLGAIAVKEQDYYLGTIKKIVNTRNMSMKRLKELGFKVLDSSTNFLFAKHQTVPAKVMFEELKKRNIFVRYFSAERVNEYLRITVGTDEQMEIVYKAMEEIIQKC